MLFVINNDAFIVVSIITLIFVSLIEAGPCDIYAKANTPCVAAHSVSRALYDDFAGALYQIERKSDKKRTDVGLIKVGGIVNATIVDAFCPNKDCVINQIYDQSENQNHLTPSPPGGAWPFACNPVNATKAPFTIGTFEYVHTHTHTQTKCSL